VIRQVVQLDGEVHVLHLEAVGRLNLHRGEVQEGLDRDLQQAVGDLLGLLRRDAEHADLGSGLAADAADLVDGMDQQPAGQLAPHLHHVVVKGGHEAVALLGEVLVGQQGAAQVAHAHDGQVPLLVQAQDLLDVEQELFHEIADPAHAELAEIGQVLADLGGVDPAHLGQGLAGDDRGSVVHHALQGA